MGKLENDLFIEVTVVSGEFVIPIMADIHRAIYEESTFTFGQFIYQLVNNEITEDITLDYMNSMFIKSMCRSPNVTFCPEHPSILLETPVRGGLKCINEQCKFEYCKKVA